MTRIAFWIIALLLIACPAWAQAPLAARVDRAIRDAGVLINGVSIGDAANKATWKVQPTNLQAQAQPVIDAFNSTDPVIEAAELDAEVKRELDAGRLISAVVWTILKQMFPSDTDAQTKTKYGVARSRIIDAYKLRPWQ